MLSQQIMLKENFLLEDTELSWFFLYPELYKAHCMPLPSQYMCTSFIKNITKTDMKQNRRQRIASVLYTNPQHCRYLHLWHFSCKFTLIVHKPFTNKLFYIVSAYQYIGKAEIPGYTHSIGPSIDLEHTATIKIPC